MFEIGDLKSCRIQYKYIRIFPFLVHLLLVTIHVEFKATSDDLDTQPFPEAPMHLSTYLSDFRISDE